MERGKQPENYANSGRGIVCPLVVCTSLQHMPFSTNSYNDVEDEEEEEKEAGESSGGDEEEQGKGDGPRIILVGTRTSPTSAAR